MGWSLCWEFSSYLWTCSPQGIDSQTTLLLVVSSKNALGIERKRCIQDLASPNKDEGHYICRLDVLFGTFCWAFRSLRCCRSDLLDHFYLPCRAPLLRSAFRFRLGEKQSCFSSGSFALPDGRTKGLWGTTHCSGDPEALRGSWQCSLSDVVDFHSQYKVCALRFALPVASNFLA